MSYVSPAALPRPDRHLVSRGLLLRAILAYLAGAARLVPEYQSFQAVVTRGDVSAHHCSLGFHLSPSAHPDRVRDAPRLFGMPGDIYLSSAPWLLGFGSLLLLGNAIPLPGSARPLRRRSVLIVLLFGSGLVLAMLQPCGFCKMPGNLN